MNKYDSAIARLRARWGAEFTEPDTTREQRGHFRGDRIEVTTTYDNGETFVRRGRLSITSGWAPSLMLIHRRNTCGSWDLLDKNDKITATIGPRGERHATYAGGEA